MILNSIMQFFKFCFYKENKHLFFLGIFFILFVFFLLFFSAPFNFPSGHIVTVEEGLLLDEIASNLKEKKIIRHAFLFKTLTYLSGNQTDLMAGGYFFDKKLNLFRVIYRLSVGQYGLDPTTVILHEGTTVREMAEVLSSTFEDFDKDRFVELAEDKEGYLFPDTYSFLPSVEPEEVISSMERNFDRKIEDLLIQIEESGYSLNKIITMASLLEEEARTIESKELIAGILWKRIEIGMALQVDAVFPYIINKNTYELTLEDLDFDSPYNTYKYRGLPPGPITNPGLASIEAALNPRESNFLFYLSDRDGEMHYAEDFEGHKMNKALYLN